MYQRPTFSPGPQRHAGQAGAGPARPLVIVILDADARMPSYARMENCRALPQPMAIGKAHTSAMSDSDAQRLKNDGRNNDLRPQHCRQPDARPQLTPAPVSA